MMHPNRRASRQNVKKSIQVKKLIANAVENNVLFSSLDSDQINEIVNVMWSMDVKKGTSIIKQGESGDNFYVVEKGIFNIYVIKDSNEKLVAQRGIGESFGELALMYNAVRSATVKAKTDCKVWAVERYMFRKILIKASEHKIKEYCRFLKSVPLLDSLLTNERREVAECLTPLTFNEGDVIVNQGEIGDTFYIIKKGKAIVYKSVPINSPPKKVGILKEGNFFGERALIKNETRAATVQVIDGKMTCLCLNRDEFCLLLGPLAELMKRKIDRDYDSIKGGGNPNIYLNNNNNNNSNNSNKIILNDDTLLNDINTIINNVNANYKDINMDDLITVSKLGKGSFGSVNLVKHKITNETYALKIVNKSQVVKTGQQEHIISEKNVMMLLDSQFIVKLYNTYKDKKNLYFLLEVVLGGELFTVLRARTVFNENTARFYTASVVYAFNYMHKKSIIYRDLKPENLLLDNKGYLKITDFGFAKIINDRTYTLCGTPDYLAPEVIAGSGHSKAVDWWTLGVLLYEMLASYPPFYHEDPMKTYAKIMYGKIIYPKHFSNDSINIIRSFLMAKPNKRLGIIKGGLYKIQQHLWFKKNNFNWELLYQKKLKAPIIPNIKNREDTSNFEIIDENDIYNDNDSDNDSDNNNNNNDTPWDDEF